MMGVEYKRSGVCYYQAVVRDLVESVEFLINMAGEKVKFDLPSGVANGGDDDVGPVRMFRTFSDPGRKKSLKSLEIPLENLLSGIIFLSGGRDKRNGPVVSMTQPEQGSVEMLMEIMMQDVIDMLAYFTSVPNEETRAIGFTIILDADVIHDFLMRPFIKALNQLQNEGADKPFHQVLFVSSTKDISLIDWNQDCRTEVSLPFQQVISYDGLQEFIVEDQLTAEFGGSLPYDHQDWVRFRMQVEPFLCDCISISKRLARAIEPFTSEEVPSTIQDAEQSIHKHKLTKRKTLDSLHIDDLTSEGERINEHMQIQKQESKELGVNPDFENTLDTIRRLMSQIDTVKGRLDTLWSTRHDKLEANLKQKLFEKEAKQIIEWFEEYAEEFFETHTELGENLEVAIALVLEVQQFEDSTEQIIVHTDDLILSGTELEQHPLADHDKVQLLMGKVKQLMTDFESRLQERKRKLDDSVKLHRLTEVALDWCIESAALLSEYDICTLKPADIEADFVKAEFDQFLLDYPPPSDEDLHTLLELSEREDGHLVKENSRVAYKRVLEIIERFHFYIRVLDDWIQEKADRDAAAKQELVRTSHTVVRAVNHLVRRASGDVGLDTTDGDDFLQFDSPPEVSSGGQELNSLHYDDLGIDHALMLLEQAAKSASDRLDSQRAELPAALRTGGESSPDFPEPSHTLRKTEISGPSHTRGVLFQATSIDLVDEDDDPMDDSYLAEGRRACACPEPEPEPLDEDFGAQTKHARHRRKLMEELLETERTYINDLQWVVDEYMPAMDNLEELPRNLLGKKNLIFSNIPHILEFNMQHILPELESCRKCPVKLGEIFLRFEEELLNYSMYFKNMPLQTQLMEEGGFAFFMKVQMRLGDTFPLGSYLIKPFQRMTRYRLFLQDMIKHSTKTDTKGKLKEYYDKLKEAQKMADFILRHGNDLLAVECLKGFEGSLKEQGKILRQGDLTIVERTKHRRKAFLFENSIIFAKKKKTKNHHHHHLPEVASSASDIYELKDAYKTSEFGLRENISGHPTRFELWKKKFSLVLQAETEEQKNEWVQDIWDLFFGHMLTLKDQNLEAHGSRPLTAVVQAGQGTLKRRAPFGHALRRHTSLRYSAGSRISQSSRSSRPVSIVSNFSMGSHASSASDISPRTMTYSPGAISRVSSSGSTFVDLKKNNRLSAASLDSDRSSIASSSSSACLQAEPDKRGSKLVCDVRRAGEDGRLLVTPSPLEYSNSSSSLDSEEPESKSLEEEEEEVATPIYDTPL